MRRRSRVILAVVFAALGCDPSAVDDDSAGSGTEGGSETADLPAPRFADLQADVLTPSCVFAACHKGAAAAGGLSLDPGQAYAALVGTPAVGAPTRVRVVPGDVDASYLIEKLESETPAAGDPMPPAARLSQERLDLIRRWIEAGALDN